MKSLVSNTTSHILAVCVAIGCSLLLPQASTAQQITRDLQTETIYEGSRVRVNLSGNLRYLSENIGSAACVLAAGWDDAGASERLAATQAEFDTVLNALLFGNVNLGVPSGERASRVRTTLRDLLKTWTPTSVEALQLQSETDRSTPSVFIAQNGIALDAETQILTEEILGEYVSRSDLLVADALTSSVASRQLKLLRQIEKLSCGTLSGQVDFGNIESLGEQMQLFEVSLEALSSGMESAGVMAPPTEELGQLLSAIQEDWNSQKALLASQLETNALGADGWQRIQEGFDQLFNASRQAVSLYSRAANGSEEATRRAVLSFAENELARWLSYRETIGAFRENERAHSKWLLDLLVKNSRGLVIGATLVGGSGSKIVETENTVQLKAEFTENDALSTRMTDPVWDPELQVFRSQISVAAGENMSGFLVADVNILPFM